MREKIPHEFRRGIWKKALSLMEADLTATTLSTWFDDARAVALEGDCLAIHTPSNFKKDIISSRYVSAIQKALRELFSTDFDVVVLGGRGAGRLRI